MLDAAVHAADLHPRPQLVRSAWKSLDGSWGFRHDDGDEGTGAGWAAGFAADRTITVPFPPESPASGIGETGYHPVVWYSRELTAADLTDGRPQRRGTSRAPAPRRRRLPRERVARRRTARHARGRSHAVLLRHHRARDRGRRLDPRGARGGRPARRRPAPRQAGLAARPARHLVPPHHRYLAARVARGRPGARRAHPALDARPAHRDGATRGRPRPRARRGHHLPRRRHARRTPPRGVDDHGRPRSLHGRAAGSGAVERPGVRAPALDTGASGAARRAGHDRRPRRHRRDRLLPRPPQRGGRPRRLPAERPPRLPAQRARAGLLAGVPSRRPVGGGPAGRGPAHPRPRLQLGAHPPEVRGPPVPLLDRPPRRPRLVGGAGRLRVLPHGDHAHRARVARGARPRPVASVDRHVGAVERELGRAAHRRVAGAPLVRAGAGGADPRHRPDPPRDLERRLGARGLRPAHGPRLRVAPRRRARAVRQRRCVPAGARRRRPRRAPDPARGVRGRPPDRAQRVRRHPLLPRRRGQRGLGLLHRVQR